MNRIPQWRILCVGAFLAIQWLRLRTSKAGAMGLIPGQGTEIPLATQCGKIEKKKRSICGSRRVLGHSHKWEGAWPKQGKDGGDHGINGVEVKVVWCFPLRYAAIRVVDQVYETEIINLCILSLQNNPLIFLATPWDKMIPIFQMNQRLTDLLEIAHLDESLDSNQVLNLRWHWI